MKHTYLVALSSALLLLFGVASPPAHAAPTDCSGGGSFTVAGTSINSTLNCEGEAVIPAGVTIIGPSAFELAEFLGRVTFESSSSLTEIRSQAFAGTGITSITIPAGVTTIGAQAFADSRSLTSVTFRGMTAPSAVSEDAFTRIGDNAQLYLEDGATGFGSVGQTWKGLLIAAGGTIITPDPEPEPEPVSSSPAPLPSFPTKAAAFSKSFSLYTPFLAKQQKKKLRTLIKQVGAGGSFEVVAGVAPSQGVTKSQAKALALAKARAIKNYLVLRGVKKKDVSLKIKIYKVGEIQGSLNQTLVFGSTT
jgi:hypothetical protein